MPHREETYQSCRTEAVCWLEHVLEQIGIEQDHVNLSVKARDFHEHHCFTALLVVEADPAIPFAGGIVTATSTDDTLSV